VRFAWIEAEKAVYPRSVACRVLGVTRSGFYAWRKRPPSRREIEDARLGVEIAAIHRRSRRAYGSPRVQRDLRAQGLWIGRKRIQRLMRLHSLVGKHRRRFRTTTNSRHGQAVAENIVNRNFTVDRPNAVWVGDITYVWTAEGWLYVAVLLDLFSRMVIGWGIHDRMDRGVALEALRMALRRRGAPAGVVHHTDRGSQYVNRDYKAVLGAAGAVRSMSRKGNCWDNAVAESFFATLKRELLDGPVFPTRAEARAAIAEYIERFYNFERRHSHLDYVSPIEYETAHRRAQEAA
jgi:putative transposase